MPTGGQVETSAQLKAGRFLTIVATARFEGNHIARLPIAGVAAPTATAGCSAGERSVTVVFIGQGLRKLYGCAAGADSGFILIRVVLPRADRLTGRGADSPCTGRLAANHVFQKAGA